jgi:hypothetical protein
MTFIKQFTEKDIIHILTDKLANSSVIAKRSECSIFTAKRLLNELHKQGKVRRVEIDTTKGVTYAWSRIL